MIIEKYKEVLYELYDVKITREELIKIINQFIEKHNIFFVFMDIKLYGMIFFDGTIIVNRIYYTINYRDDNAFVIYYILLCEIMQAI